MAVGKNITWKKERRNNIPFPIILRQLGIISSGEEDGNFGEDKKYSKKLGWGRISSCKELYTPLLIILSTYPTTQRTAAIT